MTVFPSIERRLLLEGHRAPRPDRRSLLAVQSCVRQSLLIAVVGLFGVTAYAVTQRQRELAIRLALGATVGAVVRLIVTQGGRVVLAGVAVGVGGAAVAGRVLAGELHGVKWFDLGLMSVAVSAILLAAAAAIWWPARRAATVNPVMALTEQ